jgi:lipoprotein-anchoring transpeptidase ErfK/SrfK
MTRRYPVLTAFALSTLAATGGALAEDSPYTTLPYTPSLDVAAMDRTADPCQDLYQYSCGGWMKSNPIPGDQASWSVYGKLHEDNQRYLWGLLQEAAKPNPRVRAKRPPAVNAQTTGVNFFGDFNLLRLFGIAAIPRSTVAFSGTYKPGTIVIHTNERRLYLVLGNGEALRYGIGVGREGFTWRGVNTVTDKREWPSWTPPPQMLARKPNLPRHMAGGPDNPLGARAMYLGDTLYRIHGTNEYNTIGSAESSGCIRLTNDDVIDLYNRVRIGTTVIVQ